MGIECQGAVCGIAIAIGCQGAVCDVGCQGAVWCGVAGWELLVVDTRCQGAVLCVSLDVRELFGVVL